LNFLISMAVVIPLAIGSWHLVEKHAGRFRAALFGVERVCLAWRGGPRGWLKGRKTVAVAEERRV
jgi:peptidoglycan/LPS O-acetylase OafA/YrhL